MYSRVDYRTGLPAQPKGPRGPQAWLCFLSTEPRLHDAHRHGSKKSKTIADCPFKMPKMTTLVNPVCLNKDTFICNNYCDVAFLYSCATNPTEMQVNVWANDLVRPISVSICIWVRVLEGEAGEGLQSPRAQGPDISSSLHACTGDRGSRLNC